MIYQGTISENFRNAFNLDYNGTGLFTVTFTGDTTTRLGQVIITANYPGAVFVDTNTLSYIEVEVLNIEPVPNITVDDISFIEADTNPCQNVGVVITTNILANNFSFLLSLY